jgi:hypothetical protein
LAGKPCASLQRWSRQKRCWRGIENSLLRSTMAARDGVQADLG